MDETRVEISDGWLLTGTEFHATAQNIYTGEELTLEGTLAASLWVDRASLIQYAAFNSLFAQLAALRTEGARPPTLGDVMAPQGWGVFFLELTGRCNESCSHCYASSSPSVDTALDWRTIERCVREAHALGFTSIQFTGGDPLVSEHIEAAVELAAELGGWKREVYTNALALRPALVELFRRTSTNVAVSVYSHDPAVHDSITRTAGSHERTCAHLRQAMEAGVNVRVGSVQGCSDSQDELKLRDFLLSMGLKSSQIAVDRQRPVGRGSWTPETELLPGDSAGHARGEPGRGKLSVSYTGNVVPCIFDRGTVLGTIDSSSLTEILAQPVGYRGSRPSLTVVGQPLACIDCRARNATLKRLSW